MGGLAQSCPEAKSTSGCRSRLLKGGTSQRNADSLRKGNCLKTELAVITRCGCFKVKCLVHEVILINIWKHKVLPNILKLKPNPQSTFLAYSILYHEGVCVSLLELVVYHMNCCEGELVTLISHA